MLLVGISPNRFTPTAYPGEPLFHVTVPYLLMKFANPVPGCVISGPVRDGGIRLQMAFLIGHFRPT